MKLLLPSKQVNQTSNMAKDTAKRIINDAVANLVTKDHMDTLVDKLQNNIEEMMIRKISVAPDFLPPFKMVFEMNFSSL